MPRPRRRLIVDSLRKLPLGVICLVLAMGVLAAPNAALAQYGDEPQDVIRDADGRLRGYEESDVVLDHSGTFLTYLTFVGLTLLGVGVMFKSSRRSHLD